MLALPDDAIAALTIQDVALCQVWMSNGGSWPDPPEGLDSLPARVRLWLASVEVSPPKSEGRRTQSFLRELIDRLEDDQTDKMNRDELDLLETVFGFAHAIQNPAVFARVRHAIAPRRARIAARRAMLPPVKGAPTLSARLLVVGPRDVTAAQPREVRRFAGVDLPSRGPVLAHSGHVRVLGDVPEGTSLVVEEGGCVVDGFVLGRIAVSGNCEVMENVSGVVISRNGDVRARHLIDGAFVVAKRGWIHCRRIHGAKLVFAGGAIRVAERSSRARLFAPDVRVGDSIEGGEVHASQSIAAGTFRSPPDAPLNLVFRRGLSCKDYGEDPGKPMAQEVSRALRSRAELSFAQQQLRLTIEEAEGAAETALTYILAGDAAGQLAGEVLNAQRRLDVLNRVLMGLRALYAETEASIDSGGGAAEGEAAGDGLLDRLDKEICEIVVEGAGDAALQTPYEELQESRARIRKVRGSKAQLHTTLSDLGEKLQRWRAEFIELAQTVRNGRENIRKSVQTVELFEENGGSRSRVLTLQRLMRRVLENPANDGLRKRVESPFVAMVSRTIEARLAQARKFKVEEARFQKAFDLVREHVWRQYQMKIEAGDSAAQRITAEGRFETTARLWADAAYLDMPPAEVPKGGVFVAPPSDGEIARYVCAGSCILPEAAGETAAVALQEAAL